MTTSSIRIAQRFAVTLVIAAATIAVAKSTAQAGPEFDLLDHGVNFDWWASATPVPPSLSAAQLKDIRAAGFNHVRIPLNTKTVIAEDGHGFAVCAPDVPLREYFRAAIPAFAQANLAMVPVVEPSKDRPFQDWIAQDTSGRRLADVVGCLIATASAVDATYARSKMAFGLLNEPHVMPATWNIVQSNAVRLLKAKYPDAKLLVTPAFPPTLKALLDMPRISVPGVAAEFHYYEPYEFNFQGDPHTPAWLASAHGLTFGAKHLGQECDAASTSTDPATLCAAMKRHDLAGFTAARVAQDFHKVVAWAGGTYVYVGEYGVHVDWPDQRGADREAAAAWFQMVVGEFRRARFGRAVYELGCGFGILRTRICDAKALQQEKTLDFDPVLLRALN
ncbi:MAG: cellulase family glycosylhydrolase [Methylocella sp.]